MSRMSWDEWGRERGRRSLEKDFIAEKNEALEDREVSTVYVIINEWTDIANNTSSEVVGGSFFETEDKAWDALAIIAQSFDDVLLPGETALIYTDHTHNLQSEEYYIQELTNRG